MGIARLATAPLVAVLVVTTSQQPPATVAVSEVVEREVTSVVELVGSIEPVRRSIVAAGCQGLVVQFEVRAGDRVTSGQELARLRTRTLEIQKSAAQAAQAQAEYEFAELSAGSRPEEIERARAALAASEARARWADLRQQRLRALAGRDAASTEEFDLANSLFDQMTEDVARLRADYALMKLGPRQEKKAQSQARLDEAKAEVARVDDDLSKRQVRAPFDGYVVHEHTEVGQWLTESSPVVELVDLNSVDVHVMVPERYIRVVKMGAAIDVRVEAIDGRSFDGKVEHIVPQADRSTRQFPVRLRVHNELDESKRPALQAGMSSIVQMPLGRMHRALLVPKDALVLQAGRSVVYVVDGDAEKRTVASIVVVPGAAHESLVEVKGSLRPGQQVVIRGNERLSAGQSVQIVEP